MGTGESEETAIPRCRACGRSLEAASDLGWECECGTLVCGNPECIEEWFKSVADGEATRCLACGLVT